MQNFLSLISVNDASTLSANSLGLAAKPCTDITRCSRVMGVEAQLVPTRYSVNHGGERISKSLIQCCRYLHLHLDT